MEFKLDLLKVDNLNNIKDWKPLFLLSWIFFFEKKKKNSSSNEKKKKINKNKKQKKNEQTPIVKEDKFFSQADVVLTGKNVLKNVLFTDIFTGFIKI